MCKSISRFTSVVAFRATASFLGLLGALCFSALSGGAQTLPNDPLLSGPNNCNVTTTMFNSFFHSGTAKVDGLVDPANSVTFSNNTSRDNRLLPVGAADVSVADFACAPAVVSHAPVCALRPSCKWWLQEGIEACLLCPQVVTQMYGASAPLVGAATPSENRRRDGG
jgi:hypothetical protein